MSDVETALVFATEGRNNRARKWARTAALVLAGAAGGVALDQAAKVDPHLVKTAYDLGRASAADQIDRESRGTDAIEHETFYLTAINVYGYDDNTVDMECTARFGGPDQLQLLKIPLDIFIESKPNEIPVIDHKHDSQTNTESFSIHIGGQTIHTTIQPTTNKGFEVKLTYSDSSQGVYKQVTLTFPIGMPNKFGIEPREEPENKNEPPPVGKPAPSGGMKI